MSRDIRSFFLPKGKKPEVQSQDKKGNDIKKIRKRLKVIDSDSEDEQKPSPKRSKNTTSSVVKPSTSKPKEKLKPVNVQDVFGNDKIKRSSPQSSSSKKSEPDKFEEIHSDDDFAATLCQIDELEAAYIESKEKQTEAPSKITPDKKNKHSRSDSVHGDENDRSVERTSIKKDSSKNSNSNEEICVKEDLPATAKETPPKSKPLLDSSVTSPLDPAEKKRQHAIHYMKYLHREGPKHLGSKEIPIGKKGCFSGLVFVITGVLDSLERDDAVKLIEQYGGKVTSNVSRNTSYVVYGNEPGPTKMSKATSLGTPQINEDELLNLITLKSQTKADSPREEKVKNKKHKQKESMNNDSEKPAKKAKFDEELKSTDTECSKNNSKKEEGTGTKNSKKHSPISEEKTKSIVETNQEKKGNSPKIIEEEFVHHKNKLNSKKNSSPPEKPSPKTEKKREDINNHPQKSNFVSDKLACKNQEGKCDLALNSDVRNTKSSLWVDKYRPSKTKNIIGQQGDRSSLKKLMIWLEHWHKNHSGHKAHPRPSPWAKNDDGAFFKAALLSGPPGIGKTTMAHLASQELGFDVVEFNASDTRSKKLLHVEISELLSNKSLFGYFHGSENNRPTAKHVLLMDEVDGMAGNEDRGGMQELIQLIKSTRIPIICMCNDRNHPKIRSLANYCFDLRVMKPRLEQIRGAMMSVCFKEGLKISADALTEIICGANFDMRQILHHLSLWSAREKNLSQEEAKKEANKARKDMKLGPWDVVKKVFSAEDHKNMSIHDKSDLFFYDYSINPLFVQENYLSVVPTSCKGNVVKTLNCIASAAESISMGDLVEKCIRSRGAWNLLPVQALFSSIVPGDAMEGYFKSQINFPSWLGKNSRTGKLDRLLQELHVHTRLNTSGSKQALNLEYLPHIRDAILQPLVEEGSSGVPTSLSVLQSYSLLREDLESIIELTQWPNQKDPMSAIESKVKAALTRAYNKEGILTPYSVVSVVKKRSGGGSQDLDYGNDEDLDDEDEEGDELSVDAMIKAKKPSSKKQTEPKVGKGRGSTSKETSARGKERGRGRGRGKQ